MNGYNDYEPTYDPGYSYNNNGNNNNNNNSGNTLKIVLITLVSVLIVIVLIVGILLLIQKNKDNTPAEAPNAAAGLTKVAEQDNAVAETTTNAVSTYIPTEAPTAATTPVVTAPPATAPAPSRAPNLQYSYPSPSISWASTVKGSVLESSNVTSARSFGADQAIDGYANTCWCVNTDRQGGAGGTITLHLSETSYVSGISLINGNVFLPSDGLYKSNGQVRDFTLTFSDGSSLRYTANFNYASSDFETFRFAKPVITDTVTLRVDSAYVGQKYTTNVCIGEIEVF